MNLSGVVGLLKFPMERSASGATARMSPCATAAPGITVPAAAVMTTPVIRGRLETVLMLGSSFPQRDSLASDFAVGIALARAENATQVLGLS